MNDYRIVVNKYNRKGFVSNLYEKKDCIINYDAGLILWMLNSKQIDIRTVQEKQGSFLKKCLELEYIKNNKLNYRISLIDTPWHLKRVQIELTRFCNLSCSYCYSTSGPHQKSKLNITKVKEFIDDAYELGCIWIDFTGGEPLAFKGCFDILRYANKKGIVCSLHTNGTLLNKKTVKKLKEIGIRHVQISLDSHIEQIHDSARGKKGAYNKTIEGIKNCKEENISVQVSVVAHKKNSYNFRETVKFLRNELKVKVLMDRVIKAGKELDANLGLTTSEYYSLIHPLIRPGVSDSKVCDNFISDNLNIEPSCGVAHSFVYITAEGEFALCPTMTSRDRPNIFNSPRLESYTLKEAWNDSDYFIKYRGLNCSNINKCPASSKCGGGCRSNAYIESNILNSPDMLSCNVFKNKNESFYNFADDYKANKL